MKTSPVASLTVPIASPCDPAVVDCSNCRSPGSCSDDTPPCPSAGLPASTIVRPDYRFLGEGQRSNRRPIPPSLRPSNRGASLSVFVYDWRLTATHARVDPIRIVADFLL